MGVTESELTFDTLPEHLFDCQVRIGNESAGEQVFGFGQRRSYGW